MIYKANYYQQTVVYILLFTISTTVVWTKSKTLKTLDKLNIRTHETHIHDCQVYKVQEFSQPQRNHYDSRNGERIQHIILHYTHSDFTRTMKAFTSPRDDYQVSAHYVITRDGTIIYIVPEDKRAWHAGDSYWNGSEDLNSTSIGIEIINTGFTKNSLGKRQWHPFTHKQISSLGRLCQGISNKYNIHPQHVLGHADIAPHRKHDPGILFPWSRLYYEYGVGAWLENINPEYIQKQYSPKTTLPRHVDSTFVLSQLQKYGYNITTTTAYTESDAAAVRAFKAHFSDNKEISEYNGSITYDDMVWIWGLVAKYK